MYVVRRKWQATLLAALAIATAGLFAGNLVAQPPQPGVQEAEPEDAAVFVGVYQPQLVFERAPGHQQFIQQMQQMQTAMQAAAEAGDQERIMQLQQQAQQAQQQVVEDFHRDVQQVLPQVAEAAEVQLIAVDVAYRDDDVAVRDVTEHVAAALAEQAGQPEPPQQPQELFPPGPPQQ